MSEPCIITVAITGAVPTKEDTPALPVTPEEQIESTHEAYEAGASLVHIHVRNEDQTPSSDPDKYHAVQEGVKKHCPGMIIQFSTGGRGRDQEQRGGMLHHRPDMASLATGSVNFPSSIYENPPDFVESLATRMLEFDVKPEIEVFDGLITTPVHLQFVLGIPNALPARRSLLEFLNQEREEMLPGSTWAAAGIARHQFDVNLWCLKMGGHCRTGLEDNIKFDRDRLAVSNAELVTKVVDIADEFGRRPATPTEAREILGLAKAD